jgi:hypothetical protein
MSDMIILLDYMKEYNSFLNNHSEPNPIISKGAVFQLLYYWKVSILIGMKFKVVLKPFSTGIPVFSIGVVLPLNYGFYLLYSTWISNLQEVVILADLIF